MENALQLSSAAATVEGPLEAETGHGLLHLPDAQMFALAAGADGRPSDNFSVRILTKALRIAFRPKEGAALPASLAEKSQLIRNAIRAAGEAIATQPSERRTGGATLAVVAFDPTQPGSALVLNVGDCRCYRFRNSRPECLTRSMSAADTAEETPLLMDVLNNAIGGDEPPEIEEQSVAVQPGDAFVLVPGSLFRSKPDLAVGRALRRVPGKGADLMAASLVEEALKTESAAGIALVVKTDFVIEAASETQVDETAGEQRLDEEPEVIEEEALVEQAAADAEPGVDKSEEPEKRADVVENSEDVAQTQPVEAAAPKPKRKPRKTIADDSAELPIPATATEAEPASNNAILAAAAAPPPKPGQKNKFGPLTRAPLLHTEAPQGGRKPLPLFEIAVVAVIIATLAGGIMGGIHFWKRHKARAGGEVELAEGATAAGIVTRARINGEWGNVEKSLAKLPPLASGDEDIAHAWIARWNAAAAPDFSEIAARTHLDMLGALVTQAGGPTRPPLQIWTPENRANEFCRIAGERQRQLAGAIESSLAALNKRGDIPFADHTEQNAALAGIGRFTRGRYATKLSSIMGDFAYARTAENQLEAVINLRKLDLPLDDATLLRVIGEPLRQLNTSLDRAWESLLDIAAGSATDSAQWRKTAPTALAQRLNRLDAIRQNVIAERKRFGDIRRWRTNVQNKQLVGWLLDETAKLGAQLNPAPAPTIHRR